MKQQIARIAESDLRPAGKKILNLMRMWQDTALQKPSAHAQYSLPETIIDIGGATYFLPPTTTLTDGSV